MKELSIEEKAKAYDEAIERAKEYKKHGYMMINVALDNIFPKLKENWNEKVRKWLIEMVEEVRKANPTNAEHNGMCSEAIAWLEKQSEQKPKFRVGDTIKCKYDDRQFTVKSVDLEKGTYAYTKKGCGNDIDYADEAFELVEQKPAEWTQDNVKELTDFEIAMLHIGESFFGKYHGLNPNDTEVVKEQAKFLMELIQKPAWSEEDERLCLCLIEDQEEALDKVRNDKYGHSEIISDLKEMYHERINFLKSLKQRYTWKPSDEQMKALSNAGNSFRPFEEGHKVLWGLYNDLKKLREE